MILLLDFYQPSNYLRFAEYLYALHENLKHNLIEKIILFISDDFTLSFKSDKIQIVHLNSRPTYDVMFNFCNENFNDICILGNSDIIFDESLSLVTKENLKNTFYALSRRELQEDYTVQERPVSHLHCSQDAWFFLPKIKFSQPANFTFGVPCCDRRISRIAKDSGYIVKNPYDKIILKHAHQVGYRSYQLEKRTPVPGPYFDCYPSNEL